MDSEHSIDTALVVGLAVGGSVLVVALLAVAVVAAARWRKRNRDASPSVSQRMDDRVPGSAAAVSQQRSSSSYGAVPAAPQYASSIVASVRSPYGELTPQEVA